MKRPSLALPCPNNKIMKLETQLKTLAELGLSLNAGITIEDLLYSFKREAYEQKPFDLLLFMMGGEVEREPWGRPICSRMWNFDTECINGTGDYVRIAKRLCAVANQPNRLRDMQDFVDLDTEQAWLQYTVDGKQRHWTLEVNNDWADTITISYLMDDIERGDRCRFYAMDNGQAMILFYLDEAAANELSRLSGKALRPAVP